MCSTAKYSPDLGGGNTEADSIDLQAEEFLESDDHVYEDVEDEDNEPWEADGKSWWSQVYG